MVENFVKEVKLNSNGRKVHQSSSIAAFDQITPPSSRRKRLCLPSSLNPVYVNRTVIAVMPAPAAIPSHASVATIPAYVTAGTNNGSDINILDVILRIIYMGVRPASTVALISLRDTIQNILSRAQVYLQEEVEFLRSPNSVSDTSELPLLELSEHTINELLRCLYRMRRVGMENFKPSTTRK